VVSTCMQQALEEEGLEEGDDAADAPVAGLADLVGAAAAELMGFYLLSSVLMMRGSLPHEFRQGIHEAARGLEFEFYYHFFDAIFLASFLIAAAIYVSFTLYEVRRRAARRLEQSLGSAVADQMAGVRRHDHAVQAATQRQRALARAGAPDADQNTPPQMSSDARRAQPLVRCGRGAGGGRTGGRTGGSVYIRGAKGRAARLCGCAAVRL